MRETMRLVKEFDISTLKNRTFKEVKQVKDHEIGGCNDGILFTLENGAQFFLTHEQDCCEVVYIEDVVGDLKDLENSPILFVEKSCRDATGEDTDLYSIETSTWTFFKFATVKGYVDVRFYGHSNGCYAEDARLYLVEDEDDRNN